MKRIVVCAIALIGLFHGRLFAGEHILTEWKINEIISRPQVKLEDLSGKVVMMEFWGHYCSDCVADLPELSKLDKRYSKKGLCIIGIHVRNGKTEYPKEEILKVVKKSIG